MMNDVGFVEIDSDGEWMVTKNIVDVPSDDDFDVSCRQITS